LIKHIAHRADRRPIELAYIMQALLSVPPQHTEDEFARYREMAEE